MSQKFCRQVAATVALVLLVGCQAGMKSSAPLAIAKADAPTSHAAALNNAKASAESAQWPTSPANSSAQTPDTEQSGPQVHTAFYRADAKPVSMPHVLMSKADEAACKVKVGDAMPDIELPKLGETDKTKLADLLGKKATVVVFWKSDRRMSQQQLADVGAD